MDAELTECILSLLAIWLSRDDTTFCDSGCLLMMDLSLRVEAAILLLVVSFDCVLVFFSSGCAVVQPIIPMN